MPAKILCIAGPTASGKSSRGVEQALTRGGEIISVDSRQVYRMLDIGTEKVTTEEMKGVPHHLIDVCDPRVKYSAGDFVHGSTRLIAEISGRGKLPIFVGGSHFYFDALLKGLPGSVPIDEEFRAELDTVPTEELFIRIEKADPRRAAELDAKNRRRLVRALEIIEMHGAVPARPAAARGDYEAEWIVINPPAEVLRPRIDTRLKGAFDRGLIEEVKKVRKYVGDTRLNELGLEYRVVGEYLRGERAEDSLLPTLSSQLWQYARRQKAWLRKLEREKLLTIDLETCAER